MASNDDHWINLEQQDRDEMTALEMEFREFPLCSRAMIVGPSQIGKTHFLLEYLSHPQILSSYDRVRIFYSIYDEKHDQLQEQYPNLVECLELDGQMEILRNELDSLREQTSAYQTSARGGTLLVLEDVQNQLQEQKLLGDLYTKLSSHCHTSVMSTCQSMFANNLMRTITINSNFLFLFPYHSDANAYLPLANRLAVKPQFLHSSIQRAFDKGRQPLVVNLRVQCSPSTRFYTGK